MRKWFPGLLPWLLAACCASLAEAQPTPISPTPATLVFGIRGQSSTPVQTVRLAHPPAGPPVRWTAGSSVPWLAVSPSSGTTPGRFTVALRADLLPDNGDYAAVITVTSPSALSPTTLPVTVTRRADPGAAPIGSLDYPPQPLSTAGAQAFHGWALDDVWLEGVTLVAGPDRRPVATARFAAGGRPDIEALRPVMPRQSRSAWSAVVDPAHHSWISGPVTITAVASDTGGHTTDLGSREVTFADAPAPWSWTRPIQAAAVVLLLVACGLLYATRPSPRPAATRAPLRVGALAPLVLICAVAGLVRPDSLSRGLGYDELYSASHFILGVPWTTAATGVGVFNNHPGYSVAAWVSTQLLGPEEWVVRLPAFLLGLVGVLATWLCARQVLPRWAAVAAAALLALSPEWGLWSRSARGYTGAATFAMLAVFFWHHTRASGRRGASVALGASLAVSVWMHLYAVWIMVAMASVWVTDAIRPTRTSDAGQAPHVALAGLLLGVAGALAVYAPLADGLLAVADGRGRGVFTQAFVIGLVTSFAGGSDWWVVAGTGILATLGALRLWVRDRALGMLVIAAIAVPLFMLWSAVTPRDLYSRFFVYWLPMLSLLMAAGLHVTWANRATRVPGAVLAAVLIAAWIGPATTTLETTASFRSVVPPALPGVPTLVFGADGSMLRYYAGPIAAVTSMEEIDDAWERVPELRVLYHNVAWNTPDIVALAAQLRGRCDHRTEGAVVAFTCR